MPNHITNILTIGGVSQERLAEIRLAIMNKGEDDEGGILMIDFQKILPRPAELDIVSGGLGDLALQARHGVNPDEYFPMPDEEAKKRYDELKEEDKKEAKRLGDLYFENIQKYGSKDWYDWSIKNWGTKWNAYESHADDEMLDNEIVTYGDTITFKTAWSTPEPIIRKLSQMFPDADFHMTFADEDIGANCGHYTYKKGKGTFDILENGSNEATELAMSVWGCEDDYIKVDGKWVYKEDLSEEE